MSEQWYYAAGGDTRGPVAFADLIAALAQLPDPGKTLVWRDGFDGWQPVDRVDEIAERLVRPASSKPAVREPAVGIVDVAEFRFAEPKLAGIGGWLILVAIGQVGGIFRLLGDIADYYGGVDAKLFQQFPMTFYGEAALNLALFGFVVYVTFLFFRKSRKFPRYFIYEYMAVIFVPLMSALWVAVTLSMSSAQPIPEPIKFEPKELWPLAAVALSAVIWISYILKSRRVANTFIQ